jgi:hypothetical protein
MDAGSPYGEGEGRGGHAGVEGEGELGFGT